MSNDHYQGSLERRLEAFKLVVGHLGKNKKLVIEDDTCLRRIHGGFEKLVVKKHGDEKLNNELFCSLLNSCYEVMTLKDSVETSHMQFIVALFGLLGSKMIDLQPGTITVDMIKAYIRIGNRKDNINVINSWLNSLESFVSSPLSLKLLLKSGDFNMADICKKVQSDSIFVSRSAVKFLTTILLVLYKNQTTVEIFKKYLMESLQTIQQILDYDFLMKIAAQGFKIDFQTSVEIIKNCVLDTPDFFDLDMFSQHLSGCAMQGSTVLSDFAYCYFTHNVERKHLVSSRDTQMLIVSFLCFNPLKEVGYRMLAAIHDHYQDARWTVKLVKAVFDVLLVSPVSEDDEDFVLVWREELTAACENRTSATKIACCVVQTLSQIWGAVSDSQARDELKDQLYSLLAATYQLHLSPSSSSSSSSAVRCQNEKLATALLRCLDRIEKLEEDSCCFCVGGDQKRQYLNLIRKIGATRMHSCQVLKHVFSLLVTNLKRMCDGCRQVCHGVLEDKSGGHHQQLVTDLSRLFSEACDDYSVWEMRDEAFECMAVFHTFPTNDTKKYERSVLLMHRLHGESILCKVKQRATSDSVNYVRASALSCCRSIIDALCPLDIPSHHQHYLLVGASALFVRTMRKEGDELVRRSAVALFAACLRRHPASPPPCPHDDEDANDIGDDELDRFAFTDETQKQDGGAALRLLTGAGLATIKRWARCDLDVETRCRCVDVAASLLDRDATMRDLVTSLAADRDASPVVAERAGDALERRELSERDAADRRFEADMSELDSLLDDVTFRIGSSYTSLHTHHSSLDGRSSSPPNGGEGREGEEVVVDLRGVSEKALQVDCY